jgi:sialate O-acetylesterase
MREINKPILLLIAMTWLFAAPSFANVKLPKLIASNMVLQRDAPLKIWGWADPGEKVNISFHGKNFTCIAGNEGKWLVTMPAFKTGGPFDMTIKGKNTITLKNILMGDVWVCGGQSNMEFKFEFMPEKYKDEIAASTNHNIRLLTVEKKTSITLLDDISSSGWAEANPESVPHFSAVAYFFGKYLYESTKIPVGLISSNWGGTVAEAWTSEEGLKDFPSFIKNLKEIIIDKPKTEDLEAKWVKNQKEQINTSLSDTLMAKDLGDVSSWPAMRLPGTWNTDELAKFDGVIWFTKDIELPASCKGKDLELSMPPIDDMDHTYFNGVKVGFTDGYNFERKYNIPGSLVNRGKNTITIRMTDYFLGGGMTGSDESFFLKAEGKIINLSGDWKYKMGSKFNIPERPVGIDSPNNPTVLYNGMINPLINYSIKGAIWYQGESNASRAIEYRKLFPAMINDWRAHWGQELPFLFVQLANFNTGDDWPGLREAQTMTLSLPKTGMAVTIDIGNPNDIHPRNKLDVGKRLAIAALKAAYNKNIVYSGPTYSSFKIEGSKIRITFDNTGKGLMVKGNKLNEFVIAGENGKFVKADAKIEGNTVVVWNNSITKPLAVRYAWANCPENANLYNVEGLPTVPFRTDK